jgi:hypothetical protein
MKRLLIALLIVFVLYITSYILLRSKWTQRTADNLRNEMIFPTSVGWLHAIYSPLCLLDEKMSRSRATVVTPASITSQEQCPPSNPPTSSPR